MAKATRGSERREEALSRERIVAAAIELLDDEGDNGLTFRRLATRLATGSGALYWHIANKSELLSAAADAVVDRALSELRPAQDPREAMRDVALGVYDAIDVHPWVGAQLSRTPWGTAVLRILECVGRQVQALGAGGGAQFTAASTLLTYIIGGSIQNAANGRLLDPSVNRADFLEAVSTRWQQLDPDEYPFICNVVAVQLPTHDDRAEFLAGIDLILAGIATSR